MTFELLNKIIEDNNIPKDVTIETDENYLDGFDAEIFTCIYYNEELNLIVLTDYTSDYIDDDRFRYYQMRHGEVYYFKRLYIKTPLPDYIRSDFDEDGYCALRDEQLKKEFI